MKKSVFARLFSYINTKGSRAPLAFSVLSAFLSVLLTLIAPLVIGRSIDRMPGSRRVDFTGISKTLLLLALIYLGSNLFLWLLTYLTNRISYRTVGDLRRQLFEKLNTLAPAFFDRTPRGDTISRFVNDTDILSDGMLQGFLALLSGVLTILGSLAFMLFLNPPMTLVVVLSAPASYFIARFIARRSQQLFKEQAKELGSLGGYAEEMIQGEKVVQAFRYEDEAYDHFREINARLYGAGVKAQFLSSLSNPATRIVNNVTYALIGIIGGLAAISGRLTVGDISSFLIYAVLFSKPFNDITNIFTQLQSAAASAQRVFHILDLEPEAPDAPDAVELKSCSGHVSFRKVRFAYEPGRKLIEDFSLEVPPGSSVAIVGRTGAGKTTLVNLLMRFYEIDGGSIALDGTDIRKIKRDSLRRHFGMVLQDTWLFDGSIRDNIAYARPEATMEEVVAAAKAAGADGFIRRLANGYGTVISGDGESLSQGQMQLLTIARVLLANPPMIILDEATSNIDTYTELRVQEAFSKMTAGRTSFVIAHRLSTVRNADRILVMEQGRIVEQGRHEQLLARGGAYAELYNSQFKGADIASRE